MDLASARGTKLSDIVINHRPSTGRGKRLTIPQEGVLRRLYEQELPSLSNGELPARGFWENLASQFHKRTGREYSWLSVKRRAAGWGQKSVETDRRLDTSRASELEIENSVSEPSDHEIPHDPPPQEANNPRYHKQSLPHILGIRTSQSYRNLKEALVSATGCSAVGFQVAQTQAKTPVGTSDLIVCRNPGPDQDRPKVYRSQDIVADLLHQRDAPKLLPNGCKTSCRLPPM
ncbi:unnamed protein product [Penicillium crustosum]